MKAAIVLAMIVVCGAWSVAGQESSISSYVESIDTVINLDSETAYSSILLQSTNINDITIPHVLERDLRENGRVIGVIVTNMEECVLGVKSETCIIININRVQGIHNITAIQEGAKAVGNVFIDDLNDAFGINAEFHSVFIHYNDDQSRRLALPGAVASFNTISVVYTIQETDTVALYDIISSHLLPHEIRRGGGMAEVARVMSAQPGALFLFAAIPSETDTLMQLRVTIPHDMPNADMVDTLEMLRLDSIRQSAYLEGYQPANTMLRLAVLSANGTSISDTATPILSASSRSGDLVPDSLDMAGWVFDPPSGPLIRGTYILGSDKEILEGDAAVSLDRSFEATDTNGTDVGLEKANESLVVVLIIVAGGIGAAAFYIRGYSKGSKATEQRRQTQ